MTPELFLNTLKPFAIPIFIEVFYQSITIIAWKFVLVQIRALPLFLCDNSFTLITQVKHWSFQRFSILKAEGPEHAEPAKVKIVNEIVMMRSKLKPRLTDVTCFSFTDINVLHNTELLVDFVLCFVADTDENELVF